MKHSINPEELGEFGLPIIDAIQKCVHCGFCLPACPTYQIQGQEMDSPRGRILLMKEVLEGNLKASDADPYVSRCLGCQACETACPSGVPYGHLHSMYQANTRDKVSKPISEKTREFLVHQTVPFAGRFRLAANLGRLMSPFQFLAPGFLKAMLELIPASISPRQKLPEFSAATTDRIGQVALLAGCAQQVLAPEINISTIRVLNSVGFDVVTPRQPGCCGALDWHEGRLEQARKLATKTIQSFDDNLDAIITNAAGCGSAIKEYDLVFKGTNAHTSARDFSKKVMDISTFLDQQKIPALRLRRPTKVAYHDACHLVHAQAIWQAPRRLLEQVANLELVPITSPDRCCGSAGTYNIKQPKIASDLGQLKASTILDSGCEILAAGNIGCLVQIKKHLKEKPVEILHTIEIIDRALNQD